MTLALAWPFTFVSAVENYFKVNGDKRVTGLTFMDTPWEVLSISVVYLYFCYDLGPHRLMKNREAFNLVWTVRTYNTLILLLNVWLLSKFFSLNNWGLDSIGCSVSMSHPSRRQSKLLPLPLTNYAIPKQPVNSDDRSESAMEHIRICHVFLYSRILELIDTFWITLRKKNRQITFLHVFHHSFVLLMTWFYFKIAPGGSSIMFPIINGMVHVIMYAYYTLSTFESIKPYLWWKKYVTTIQLTQFIILGAHFIVAAFTPNCPYPRILSLTGIAIAGMFFTLFIAFYREAYTTTEEKQQKLKGS